MTSNKDLTVAALREKYGATRPGYISDLDYAQLGEDGEAKREADRLEALACLLAADAIEKGEVLLVDRKDLETLLEDLGTSSLTYKRIDRILRGG